MELIKIYKQLLEKVGSNVHYILANKDVKIIPAIENGEMEKMKFLGVGERAFKKGMRKLKPNQYLYQVMIGINRTEVLYTYDDDGHVFTGIPK